MFCHIAWYFFSVQHVHPILSASAGNSCPYRDTGKTFTHIKKKKVLKKKDGKKFESEWEGAFRYNLSASRYWLPWGYQDTKLSGQALALCLLSQEKAFFSVRGLQHRGCGCTVQIGTEATTVHLTLQQTTLAAHHLCHSNQNDLCSSIRQKSSQSHVCTPSLFFLNPSNTQHLRSNHGGQAQLPVICD